MRRVAAIGLILAFLLGIAPVDGLTAQASAQPSPAPEVIEPEPGLDDLPEQPAQAASPRPTVTVTTTGPPPSPTSSPIPPSSPAPPATSAPQPLPATGPAAPLPVPADGVQPMVVFPVATPPSASPSFVPRCKQGRTPKEG